jgi:hypothetical protein
MQSLNTLAWRAVVLSDKQTRSDTVLAFRDELEIAAVARMFSASATFRRA